MARKAIAVIVIAMVAVPAAVLAHWDPSQPAKWVQFPDLSPTGIDVNASQEFILADDFECTEPGPITDIHIWGSWLFDYLPYEFDPLAVKFTLSLHSDIPADSSPNGYSMPGTPLWYFVFEPYDFTVMEEAIGIREGWMDPPLEYFFPADSVCWLYNFQIPEPVWFYQEGTPDEPVIYWLNVKAEPQDTMALFGWKTSLDHWNDDAVWGQGYEPYFGPWFELRYPPSHQYAGESIDLAFVIVGQPSNLDWGDAPEPTGAPGYPTTAMNNGANHVIGGPWLGVATDAPDPDPNGQPDPFALGDDNDGFDDENGVQIPVLQIGVSSTITFDVSGANGVVEGWIDFDGDQIWTAAEQVISAAYAPGGPYAFNVVPPMGSVVGQTFARFRISTNGGLPPDGPASDGEVEDYEVYIEDETEPPKWRQRPDLSPLGIDVNATEEFILADDFPCTETGRITRIRIWGSWLWDRWPYYEDPEAVTFTLSFHDDIPADQNPDGFSIPGDVLWLKTFRPGEFFADVWKDSIEEGWMDPPTHYLFPADWTCWMYEFIVPPEEAFFQYGTPEDTIIYWLDVQALPDDMDAFFGWKTSVQHWNDDAVWGMGVEPYLGPWYELRYPPAHQYAGESIDLAFALWNDPESGTVPDDVAPAEIGLFQNVPNPFATSTTIRYQMPATGHVTVEVFDVTGKLVRTLVDGIQPAGMQTVTWDGLDSAGRELPAGVYFQRLATHDRQLTRKMVFLK
jgi:hypothetical protein